MSAQARTAGQLALGAELGAPEHGPGCLKTIGRSRRFPGEPRYMCVPGCPRQKYLADTTWRRVTAGDGR